MISSNAKKKTFMGNAIKAVSTDQDKLEADFTRRNSKGAIWS
jgi:hypothetical protein